jgi:hypothetical protein
VVFYYSRDRGGEHPQAHLASWSGILQADAYGGYGELYALDRRPGPILEAGCFAHAHRKFFELADVEGAARKKSRGEKAKLVYPIALEEVQKLDALFAIERAINGKSAPERLTVRQELSAPLMVELQEWLKEQLAKLSPNHDLAKAINYMLRRWEAFTRFLDDGRVCLTNNSAERALRCVAKRVSLCTPYSSICKHWKRVRVSNATRATLPGHRSFYRFRHQIDGTDLMRSAWYNLHRWKQPRIDQTSYRMACGA